jgi:hypothetical protein
VPKVDAFEALAAKYAAMMRADGHPSLHIDGAAGAAPDPSSGPAWPATPSSQ